MNILAHLYLSKTTNDIMVGNFIGDAVKGKQYKNFSQTIQEGILLHRKIDHYTDTHNITINTKKFFRKSYGLYSGVVVDLLYDHFLTTNWNRHHDLELELYLDKVYDYLIKKIWVMPLKMQRMTPYIIQNNWLIQYRSLEGIERVLNGMAKYTTMPLKTSEALFTIKENYSELENNFNEFFLELKQSVNF